MSPIIARRLLQGVPWLLGFVLVGFFDFAPIDFGTLLICLILHGFFLIGALVIWVILFRFGVRVLIFRAQDTFVIL